MSDGEEIEPIRQERFDLLALARMPVTKFLAEELEWYRNEKETVIGTVFRDLTDGDFAFAILGRDETGIFRWIEGNSSFETMEDVRKSLHAEMTRITQEGKDVFEQGDAAKRKRSEIFNPIVDRSKLHPSFVILSENPAYSPAKEVIAELGYFHGTPDRNYIEQFQRSGFDARLWELYLHILLHEEDFEVITAQDAPDYICRKGEAEVTIEAVTVNPSQSGKDATAPKSPDEAAKLIHDYVPIKFGSSLYSKLQKRYWEKEIVAGKPFILAIHDFHQPGSMLWTHTGLMIYLYGYRHEHEFDKAGRLVVKPVKVERHIWGDKEIPSGFFNLPDSENISAVLSTSGGTISKFLRMGKLADFGDPRVRVTRQGAAMVHDANANAPQGFKVIVDPEHYFESWSESVSIYHNPHAKVPLQPELFRNVAHHFLQEDGQIRSQIPPVHVFASVTVTTLRE